MRKKSHWIPISILVLIFISMGVHRFYITRRDDDHVPKEHSMEYQVIQEELKNWINRKKTSV